MIKNWEQFNESKEHDIIITQYNKVRDVINSCETIEQTESARKMLRNLANWWLSDRPLVKPFEFNDNNEPIDRIGELEDLLNNKVIELSQ
jgi:hypothetical protein